LRLDDSTCASSVSVVMSGPSAFAGFPWWNGPLDK
jgi:hypothetical protein